MVVCSLQCAHRRRASRWARIPATALADRNGSTPISVRRVSAPAESLVWMVASTRWPVSADSTAIWAVSRSRISPIITMSGSHRRIERRPAANVSPAFAFTCTWLIPWSRYSTGSSTVMMFLSVELSWLRAP